MRLISGCDGLLAVAVGLCCRRWVWGRPRVGALLECVPGVHLAQISSPCLDHLASSPSALAGSGNNVVWSSVAPLYAVISVPNIPTTAPKKKKGFFGGSKAKAAAAVGGAGLQCWKGLCLDGGEGNTGCILGKGLRLDGGGGQRWLHRHV